MNIMRFAVLACIAAAATSAMPAQEPGAMKLIAPCKMCDGSGKMVCRPPDHGQYKGTIEPKSHWDVRLVCPFCKGKGRLRVYRTSMPPIEGGPPPCISCGWTGVEKCHICIGTGAVRCKAPDCRNGWVITRRSTYTGRRSSSATPKVSVTPCPECKGVGKVPCNNCDGMRGVLCRSCKGLGKGRER